MYLPINDSLKRQVTLASIKNYRHGASKLRAQKYAAAGGVSKVPRTANGTGHTGPSECFATSIQAVLRRSSERCSSPLALSALIKTFLSLPVFR